ncbi:hybrid sensor histidine kinase/response regulator transcription factor [Arsenicibacter rosenii]|uniref:histidine kinase n=1 Tax=Arsenicibacter rosenii TaxID=1750698 RepID=A0A1S2VQR8_9BACT|nr:ATP-binding protein [Arsenicibacter rosenii]OIN60730.1 hypothetical protein BLX24_01080 [Arsenicibacter rosenii]
MDRLPRYSPCLYLWVLLHLVLPPLRAQSPVSQPPYIVSARHLTFGQRVPSRIVTTFGQDAQGFIWIGTLQNAYRFDGQQFEPLMPATATANTAPANFGCYTIRTDQAGYLWLMGGVNRKLQTIQIVPPGKTKAVSFQEAFGHADPFRADPLLFFPPKDSQPFRYLITTSGRVVRHLGQGSFQTIRHLFLSDGFSDVLGTLETPQGSLLVTLKRGKTGAGSTLLEIDSLGRVLRRQDFPRLLVPIAHTASGVVYLQARAKVDPPKSLPRLTDHQLDDFLYELSPTNQLTPLSIHFGRNPIGDRSDDIFLAMTVRYDSLRNLFWIGSGQVCFAWHPTHGVVFDLMTTRLPTPGMQQFARSYVDRTGAVWLGTDDGVVLLTLEPNQFTRYLHQADQAPRAIRHSIRGMVQHGNRLWVNTNKSQWVDLQTGRSEPVFDPHDPKKSTLSYLCPVIKDKSGQLWTIQTGLVNINPQTGHRTTYPIPAKEPYDLGVSLWDDGRHHIWMSHRQGISIFDTRQAQCRSFTRYNRFPELAQSQVNGFFPDPKTREIWVAASSGLYVLDTLRGIVARYSTQNKALPFDHIAFVHPDPDSTSVYWLATLGGGLIRWNRQTGQYRQFTRKQGLADNTLYAIYEDRHHRLWLPGNYGLMAFDRQTHKIRIFHTEDGIADEEFNLIAHYRAPDGRLFLGGLNGITAFYPDQIQATKPGQSLLLVTQYHKLDPDTGKMVDYLPQFEQQKEVRLTAADRLVSLSFALPDYRYLGKTRLWFQIGGWQENWVVQNGSELRLNGLPAGEYSLKVRAQTDNGDWVSPILTIPIHIAKPFYWQAWFIGLVLAGLGSLIMIYIHWRNRQFVREKAHLEAEVARRTARIEQDKATIERDKVIIEQQAADLRESAAVKARFFANVTHEFRTPITLILGPLNLLAKRSNDFTTSQLIATMQRNAQHLQWIVNNLLDLSRLDAGQLELAPHPVDLADLTNRTVAAFATEARFTNIRLMTTGTAAPQWLLLDAPKVETVLRNLIANALKFTPPNGQITVQLQTQNDPVCLRVTDTGCGVHPDDLPYIFDRYYQSRRPDALLQGGTGIGLALCRDYCRLWQGELTVQSQWGKGSTFAVTYPRVWVDAVSKFRPDELARSTGLPSTSTTTTPRDSSRDLVLLVEDHVEMTAYLKTLLDPVYELHSCRNGRDAEVWLASQPADQLPQLIITDIMMPEMDGITFVGTIRQQARLRSIPILMLTARTDQAVRLQALRLGVADYLTKPFDEEELLTRLHNLLTRAQERNLWVQQTPPDESPVGEDWLENVEQFIQGKLADSSFQISALSYEFNMSQRRFYRAIKERTGLSPLQFVQEIRLQTAREWLESGQYETIKEVALSVGFQKPSYFARLFRQRFGINPASLRPGEGALL